MTDESGVLDVLIVGGGVSGLYAAWPILRGDVCKGDHISRKADDLHIGYDQTSRTVAVPTTAYARATPVTGLRP
jgi:hypothetical protein